MKSLPLDITKLVGLPTDDPAPQHKDAYAPTGTGPSDLGSTLGDDNRIDRRSFTPRPENPPKAVPEAPAEDAINPSHYRKHPSGIECIEVTRHMNFNIGNAMKYIWRHMDKGDPIENLQKAQWYLDDEIRRLQGLR